jgi:Spy/CpxP family protein refolding chaperone
MVTLYSSFCPNRATSISSNAVEVHDMVNIHSRVLMAGATAVLVAGLAGSAAAQQPRMRPGGPGMGMRGPGMGGRMGMGPGGLPLGQLDLSESQQSQVREVVQRYQDEMRAAGQKVADAREAQRKAIETVPLNEGLVRSVTDTLNNATLDVALIQARIYNDTYNVLTDEQKEKLKEIQGRRDARMNQRERRRQQRPQGKPKA